jgi:hypothetical protein
MRILLSDNDFALTFAGVDCAEVFCIDIKKVNVNIAIMLMCFVIGEQELN